MAKLTMFGGLEPESVKNIAEDILYYKLLMFSTKELTATAFFGIVLGLSYLNEKLINKELA